MKKNEMQIVFFNESYIQDVEEVQFVSTKTPNSQMKISKFNLVIYTTQQKISTIFLCLILIHKDNK
jgi:hypothetical protein